MKKIVVRVAPPKMPTAKSMLEYQRWVRCLSEWRMQALQDLADGIHAVGCECHSPESLTIDTDIAGAYFECGDYERPTNACLQITKKVLAFEGYSVEVEDGSTQA